MEQYDIAGSECYYFGSMQGSPRIPVWDITDWNIFNGNQLIHSSVLIKKELILLNDEEILYDSDLWFRLFLSGKYKIFNVPHKLVFHCIHNESAFNTTNSNPEIGMQLKMKY